MKRRPSWMKPEEEEPADPFEAPDLGPDIEPAAELEPEEESP